MSFADYLSPLDEIVEDAKQGRMFILVDDESRENEGDLVIPAQHCTAETINFMAKHGRGLICLALSRQRVEALGLPLMAHGNESRMQTAFTVSIEAREGITTGISAADRARTIQVAIDPKATRADLATPGHIFPLLARDGGVLVRAGHTEAAVDIARLAGLNPSGVVCEIMNDDGTMARLPDLVGFAQRHAPQGRDDRRSDLLPAEPRPAGRARHRDHAAHPLRRRLPPPGLHQRADRGGASGAGQGRSGDARSRSWSGSMR